MIVDRVAPMIGVVRKVVVRVAPVAKVNGLRLLRVTTEIMRSFTPYRSGEETATLSRASPAVVNWERRHPAGGFRL